MLILTLIEDPLAQSFIVDEEDGFLLQVLTLSLQQNHQQFLLRQKLEIWSMVIQDLKFYLLHKNG